MPERGPATMEQPETMVPPRRAEPAAEDDGNHVLDSQPDESMNRPVIEPDVEVEAEPEPEPDEPDPAAEPAPEAEDEPLGEDLEDVLGVSDVY
jgi:hypothetical protein